MINLNGNTIYMLTGDQLQELACLSAQKAVAQISSSVETSDNQSKEREYSSKIWTKREVAKMFQVTPRTIDNWVNAGIISTFKIGNVVRIDGAEIVKLRKQFIGKLTY